MPQKLSDKNEKNSMSEFSLESYDRLSDNEIEKLQLKLARLVVVFFELLHLLITRNRQRLLDVMQERKKSFLLIRQEMNWEDSGFRVWEKSARIAHWIFSPQEERIP